jgi:hypothetical protein
MHTLLSPYVTALRYTLLDVLYPYRLNYCAFHLYCFTVTARSQSQLPPVLLIDQDNPVPSLVGNHSRNSLIDLVHRVLDNPGLDLLVRGELKHITHNSRRSNSGTGNVDVVWAQFCRVVAMVALYLLRMSWNGWTLSAAPPSGAPTRTNVPPCLSVERYSAMGISTASGMSDSLWMCKIPTGSTDDQIQSPLVLMQRLGGFVSRHDKVGSTQRDRIVLFMRRVGDDGNIGAHGLCARVSVVVESTYKMIPKCPSPPTPMIPTFLAVFPAPYCLSGE